MKRKLMLISSLLLGGIILTGCNNANNNEQPVEPIVNKYLVSFYVDGVVNQTLQVSENSLIDTSKITTPSKSGYTFVSWQNSAGNDVDFSTLKVTSNLDLYAYFEINGVNPHDGESSLHVEDSKDSSKTYSLVIGWYGKSTTSGVDKELMQHAYKNIITYLTANGVEDSVLSSISVRRYGDEDTKVGPMGTLINNDGDVDIIIGVGKNLTTTGGVSSIERVDNLKIGSVEGRSIALLKETTLGKDLFDYITSTDGIKFFDLEYHFDGQIKSVFTVNFYVDETKYLSVSVNKNETIDSTAIANPTRGEDTFLYWATSDGIEYDFTIKVTKDFDLYAKFQAKGDPHEGESSLSVTDTKDINKTYSIVIGWYGKSATSGIDEALMQHAYKNIRTYLEDNNVSSTVIDNITVRQYGTSDTGVADLGAYVNADNDVNILLGTGNNIDDPTKGNVTCTTKSGPFTINGITKRYFALVNSNSDAESLYNYMVSEDGIKFFDLSYHYTSTK